MVKPEIKKEDIKWDFNQKSEIFIDEENNKGLLISNSLDDDLKTIRILIEARDLIMLNKKQKGIKPFNDNSIFFFVEFNLMEQESKDMKSLYIETLNRFYKNNTK